MEVSRIMVVAAIFSLAASAGSKAAVLKNMDAGTSVVEVAEHGERLELVLARGERVEICHSGCFLLFSNGDRIALLGNETVELLSGGGKIVGE